MATRTATNVLQLLADRMEAITSESVLGGFKASPYRFELDDEPASGVHGMFYIDMPDFGPHIAHMGNPESTFRGTVVVRVGYYRPGGDQCEGDRQSTLRNAAGDMQTIADVLGEPAQYSGSTSGLRKVIFQAASRIAETKDREIWEARFEVEWRSDLITA